MIASDRQAIKVQAAADATVTISDALSKLNELWQQFDKEVVGTIQDAWFNENAMKVMPDVQTALNKASSGINTSVASLGKALVKAVRTWEEGNGEASGTYHTKDTVENPVTMAHQFKGSDNGAEGMDTGIIQGAIDAAVKLEDDMFKEIEKIERAADDPAFEGGAMQANLRNVCTEMKNGVKKGVGGLIDNVTTNTGTAKKNVETATTTTESLFQIS